MINLYPGPSQLFYSVRDHMRQVFKLRLPELPAEAAETVSLIAQTSRRLREFLSIPPGFTIYFLPSSNIIRERIFHDLVHLESAHVVHGDLSQRLYDSALRAGKKASLHQLAQPADIAPPPDPQTELIALAHTEDAGTCTTEEIIRQYRRDHPKALIAIDASFALPYAGLPYESADTIFLDFHFGFGLPVGLAAWIVNERCRERNASIRQMRGFSNSLFSLSNLQGDAEGDRASGDASLLMIACLDGVLTDMMSRGIVAIRRETEYKAALLYHLIENHPLMKPAVAVKSFRSRTAIAADCGANYQRVTEALHEHAITTGRGRENLRDRCLVFGNFPSHSREQYEQLADILTAILQ